MEWYFWIIIIVVILIIIWFIMRIIGNKDEDILSQGSSRIKNLGDCCKKLFGFGRG